MSHTLKKKTLHTSHTVNVSRTVVSAGEKTQVAQLYRGHKYVQCWGFMDTFHNSMGTFRTTCGRYILLTYLCQKWINSLYYLTERHLPLGEGCRNFTKIHEPPQTFTHQKGDTKQVPHWGFTNIRCHHTQFSHHGSLVPGFCSPLLYAIQNNCIKFRCW
jgi:hypothetical protein